MLTELSDGVRQWDSLLRLGLLWAGCLLMVLALLVLLTTCCVRLRTRGAARRQSAEAGEKMRR
ncbi:hypothetical protein SAMN04490244_11634 [Tranquillimonas rosea]|uniref:Uncharacterized protein n=2 Tax=Roseobacteraceae TaxID=2854170 RepID=A0A1H9X1C9_9RHOB|nr:hypothetical protein SAMN04490244_11634 [Tranquillimonas rosea]SFE86631.1 hypothetical protein SAMN04515678_1208 [Roseivivax sediminis]